MPCFAMRTLGNSVKRLSFSIVTLCTVIGTIESMNAKCFLICLALQCATLGNSVKRFLVSQFNCNTLHSNWNHRIYEYEMFLNLPCFAMRSLGNSVKRLSFSIVTLCTVIGTIESINTKCFLICLSLQCAH